MNIGRYASGSQRSQPSGVRRPLTLAMAVLANYYLAPRSSL
jgi:hypothetical protein